VGQPAADCCEHFATTLAHAELATEGDQPLYLSGRAPFAMLVVGAPASGVSYTSRAVLEQHVAPADGAARFAALVVHHAHDVDDAGDVAAAAAFSSAAALVLRPTSARGAAYAALGAAPVLLRFGWAQLSQKHVVTLATAGCSDAFVDAVRHTLRGGGFASLGGFTAALLASGEDEARRRVAVLEALVSDAVGLDMAGLVAGASAVVVDATDALLADADADAVRAVAVSLFRRTPLPAGRAGKLIAVDDSCTAGGATALARELDVAAKRIRADGVRLLLGVRDVAAVSQTLWECCTCAVVHRVRRVAVAVLCRELPVPAAALQRASHFAAGDGVAVVIGASPFFDSDPCAFVRIRACRTADPHSAVAVTEM
jgi:hypothetical protein